MSAPTPSSSLRSSGIVEKEGRLPSNPSGGRVACGHVAGVSAAYSAYQVVRQLREEAVGTQVEIRQGKGLVQCNDGNAANSSVSILQRE